MFVDLNELHQMHVYNIWTNKGTSVFKRFCFWLHCIMKMQTFYKCIHAVHALLCFGQMQQCMHYRLYLTTQCTFSITHSGIPKDIVSYQQIFVHSWCEKVLDTLEVQHSAHLIPEKHVRIICNHAHKCIMNLLLSQVALKADVHQSSWSVNASL